MNPWIWATGAAIVAIFELHAPGYYLIWLALGAALTALAVALTDMSLSGQIATFALASSASCVVGFFAYRRLALFAGTKSSLNQRDQSMVGAKGVVCVSIVNGRGKVRLGDSVWLAEGPDLEVESPVVVVGIRNTIAVVEAAGSS
jgi:membrane protein implicated in regulation of membrane protease activity